MVASRRFCYPYQCAVNEELWGINDGWLGQGMSINPSATVVALISFKGIYSIWVFCTKTHGSQHKHTVYPHFVLGIAPPNQRLPLQSGLVMVVKAPSPLLPYYFFGNFENYDRSLWYFCLGLAKWICLSCMALHLNDSGSTILWKGSLIFPSYFFLKNLSSDTKFPLALSACSLSCLRGGFLTVLFCQLFPVRRTLHHFRQW